MAAELTKISILKIWIEYFQTNIFYFFSKSISNTKFLCTLFLGAVLSMPMTFAPKLQNDSTFAPIRPLLPVTIATLF